MQRLWKKSVFSVTRNERNVHSVMRSICKECVHDMTGYCEKPIYPVSIRTALYTLELHAPISTHSFQEKSSRCALHTLHNDKTNIYHTYIYTCIKYVYKSIMRDIGIFFSPQIENVFIGARTDNLHASRNNRITEYARSIITDTVVI